MERKCKNLEFWWHLNQALDKTENAIKHVESGMVLLFNSSLALTHTLCMDKDSDNLGSEGRWVDAHSEMSPKRKTKRSERVKVSV
jgi:hypothetical protein